jgi:hypothetical protein
MIVYNTTKNVIFITATPDGTRFGLGVTNYAVYPNDGIDLEILGLKEELEKDGQNAVS